MDSDSRPSPLRRLTDLAARTHAPLLLSIGVVYLGLATGLTWNLDPEPVRSRDYFPLQAGAFLSGQLHLDLAPDEAKLDMTIHDGRVYLHWGPSNALLPLLVRIATGGMLSACLWAPLYAFAGLMFHLALYERIARRHFPGSPLWVPTLFLATLALGSPLVYVAAWSLSPHTQSIALSFAAQSAVLFSFVCLAETGRRSVAVGLALALALALTTRLTVVFLLPGLLVGGALLIPPPRSREVIRRAWIPSLGAALAVVGLMVYNHARFGSVTETGMREATGLPRQRAYLYENGLEVSPRWIPLNAWLYLVRPPDFSGGWPRAGWSDELDVPDTMRDLFVDDEAHTIDAHSALIMTPALLLALLAAFVRGPSAARRLALTFALAALGVIAFLLCYAFTARRFTVDFLPVWLLVAFIGTQLA
ncbi:hypothetical protein JXA47_13615, partial [Candidatus Sumerlaeota bacterium]|nr:hypothetical protein [Candidatus Sumerlaeota bacterium]